MYGVLDFDREVTWRSDRLSGESPHSLKGLWTSSLTHLEGFDSVSSVYDRLHP